MTRRDPDEAWAEFERQRERGRAELDELEAPAREVFAAMDGLAPSTLRLLAAGLEFARESHLDRFATAIGYLATDLETADDYPEDVPGALSVLMMVDGLQRVARYHPDLDGLLERLRAQEHQPWPALAAALEKARRAVA